MSDHAVSGTPRVGPRPRPLLRTMLGDALRRARREQGRTLADVAADAQVSLPYLSELERGRKEASSEVLAAICGALRIELSDLLTEVGRDIAVVVRDHAERRARPSSVVRLTSARRRPVAPKPAGPGDVVCLLVA